MNPQFEALSGFYRDAALKLPEHQTFVQAKGLMPEQAIFTLQDMRKHLSNALLPPTCFTIIERGKPVNLDSCTYFKVVQGKQLLFMDRTVIDQYLAKGAACVLEGLDILEPDLADLCKLIEAASPSLIMCNMVAFFSQKGSEAYRGHFDSDDVLVVHLAGRKKWNLYERQPSRMVDKSELPPERMGRKVAEMVMEPGDALFVRSAVPHLCETLTPYSLHVSFDLADRNVPIGGILELLLGHYEHDSAMAYSSNVEKLGKLVSIGESPKFRERLALEQERLREQIGIFRERMRSSRVKYFDRFLGG